MDETIYRSFLETAIRYSERTALMYREQGRYANQKYKKMKLAFLSRIKCGLYNMLIASRFRKLGGGKLRLLDSGGAPLNTHIGKIPISWDSISWRDMV
jgi:long-subunit acyl-CoA synthetase (AMP-forming)